MCARLHSLCIDGDYLVNKISHSREPVFADRGSRGSFFCAAKYGHVIYEYEALRKKSRCPDQIADAPSKTFSPIVQKVVSSKMAISRRICSALIRQLWNGYRSPPGVAAPPRVRCLIMNRPASRRPQLRTRRQASVRQIASVS